MVTSQAESAVLRDVRVAYPGGGYAIGDMRPGDVFFNGALPALLRDAEVEVSFVMPGGERKTVPARADPDGPPDLYEARLPWQ